MRNMTSTRQTPAPARATGSFDLTRISSSITPTGCSWWRARRIRAKAATAAAASTMPLNVNAVV